MFKSVIDALVVFAFIVVPSAVFAQEVEVTPDDEKARAMEGDHQRVARPFGFGDRFGRMFRAIPGSILKYDPVGDTLFLMTPTAGAYALNHDGWDQRVSGRFERSDLPTTNAMNVYGSWKTIYPLTLGFMMVGDSIGSSRLADFGEEAFVALLETELIIQGVKRGIGRMRPDGSNALSMPSGHAGKTMAFALVAWKHFGWKAGVPAVTASFLTSLGRVDDQKHYLSDVVMGSIVAIVVTGMVDRFYDGQGNRFTFNAFVERQSVLLTGFGDESVIVDNRTVFGIRHTW